jgi:hypothetical protein
MHGQWAFPLNFDLLELTVSSGILLDQDEVRVVLVGAFEWKAYLLYRSGLLYSSVD